MKKAKYAGDVTVLAVITATGEVVDLETSPSDNVDAVASAIDAVRRVHFRPATLDGKPVAVRLKLIVNFRIF